MVKELIGLPDLQLIQQSFLHKDLTSAVYFPMYKPREFK